MVPLDAVMSLRNDSGLIASVRLQLYPRSNCKAITVRAFPRPIPDDDGRLASNLLPQGFSFEWTELAYQQEQAGNTGPIVFGLAVLFVFLLLAANYESWTLRSP